eukprot:12598482-Ditylum_brightwellii.AAC.1
MGEERGGATCGPARVAAPYRPHTRRLATRVPWLLSWAALSCSARAGSVYAWALRRRWASEARPSTQHGGHPKQGEGG